MREREQKRSIKKIVKILQTKLKKYNKEETIEIISEKNNQRISLVLRKNNHNLKYSIEIVIYPQIKDNNTSKSYLNFLTELLESGYNITNLDSGDISCEKNVKLEEIENEIRFLNKNIQHFLK